MRLTAKPQCPYCKVPLKSMGVMSIPSAIGVMSHPSFNLWICPGCGKIESFLVGSLNGPELLREDRENWTCTCGRVNENGLDFCSNCGDPRTYKVQ